MNILITSAGKRVSLVNEFQIEFQQLFDYNGIFTTDLNPDFAPACAISDKSFKVESVLSDTYIDDLLNICTNNNIKLIIPTIDTELSVLSINKSLFNNFGVQILVSDIDFIQVCRDKRNTQKFFNENQIDTPTIYDKNSITYPAYCKPYDGSLSKDNYKLKSEEDLTSNIINNNKMLFMEYIDPKINKEFTIDMYYDRNGFLKCLVPRERIEIRSGEINKGITRKNKLVDYFKNKLGYIKGAQGCITLQCFYNPENDIIKAIEINPRFGGGYPMSYAAGANYPKWILEEYLLNKEISKFDDWENNLLCLRYDKEILIHDFKN